MGDHLNVHRPETIQKSRARPRPTSSAPYSAVGSSSRANSSSGNPGSSSSSSTATSRPNATPYPGMNTTPPPTALGPAPKGSPFNSVVWQAMAYVKPRTNLTMEAPTYLPSTRCPCYLAATATASPVGYAVDLQLTTTPVAINSPVIDQPQNSGLAAIIGGFGAKAYGTDLQARRALAAQNGYDWAPPTNGKPASTLATASWAKHGRPGRGWAWYSGTKENGPCR